MLRPAAARISPADVETGSSSVGMDDHAAAYAMTQYLIDLGHKDIGFISGPPTHAQAGKRRDGYIEALQANGISVDKTLIEPGTFTFDSGRQAAFRLFENKRRPTAIFASNDDMAAGVLAFAYRQGISIPEDLSVVGYDDTPLASTISPRLTTIYQPVKELASESVAILLERMRAENEAEPECRLLDFKLVERESSGPPKS